MDRSSAERAFHPFNWPGSQALPESGVACASLGSSVVEISNSLAGSHSRTQENIKQVQDIFVLLANS
jgi:hypothetical protein